METSALTPLGTSPQRTLQFSYFLFGVVGPCGHALALTCIHPLDQSRGPSLRCVLHTLTGTTTPSDCRPARGTFALCAYTPRCIRRGPPGRLSPVPHRSFATCRRQYPGKPQCVLRLSHTVCCLHCEMTSSALPITFRLII